MQTIKTAIVVVLLLFVLYGGYVAMNGTESRLNPALTELIRLDEISPDVIGPSPIAASNSGNTSNSFDMFNSSPSKGFSSNTNVSPFSNPANSDQTVPPISFSSPTNSTLQPAPLLIPPTANPAPGNSDITALPPLGNVQPLNSNSTFPSNNHDKFPSSLSESSIPIPTNTPSLGHNVPDSKLSSAFPTSMPVAAPTTKPLPALDLPSELAATSPLSTGNLNSSSIKSSASKSYENAKDLAMEQIDRGNLKDALATLSVFYNASEITTEQRQDLLDLLDALSGEVVFSRRHILDMAYIVAPGETLEQVAKRYNLPSEILARINAIDTTSQLRSGEKLKVVPGPFRAEVDLAKNELTIFLGDLYAGRYPVAFGAEPSPQAGVFQVIDKQKNRNYYGNGVQIQATDPRNPFGGYWIDLGQELCIHGSSNSGSTDSKLGCISLSPMDANDVFGMLSRGSQVTIRR